MLERDIEKYFKWVVEVNGGKTYKFTSPAHRGVADRIACMSDGTTWFVELKTKGGRLSELQKLLYLIRLIICLVILTVMLPLAIINLWVTKWK
jgi:hypothetical protein